MTSIGSALLDRLGEEGADELQQILDDHRRETAEQVSTQCAERVERRVVEESSKLRLDMSQMRMDLRSELAELRTETREGFATLRGEMARDRFELLKWAFVFWVGQLFASVGLMTVLFRAVRP
jgi:hypothetical protein